MTRTIVENSAYRLTVSASGCQVVISVGHDGSDYAINLSPGEAHDVIGGIHSAIRAARAKQLEDEMSAIHD